MKKGFCVVGFLLLTVLISVGYSCMKTRKLQAAGEKHLKVGFLIAQTGYGADFGDSELMAIELLKEEFAGKLSITVEDSKSNVRDGILACRKLLDVDQVDLVYCDLTSVANAVSSLVKAKKKIMVAAVCLRDLLSGNSLAIRNLPTAEYEGRILLRYFSSLGKTTLSLVGSNDEFGRGALEDVSGIVSEYGCRVIDKEWIPDECGQIRSLAAKLIQGAPEGVYVASLSASMGNLIRELRVQNYKGEILSTDATSYEYIRANMGDSFETVTYVDFPETDYRSLLDQRALDRWGKRIQPAGLILYDGVRFLVEMAQGPSRVWEDFCSSRIYEVSQFKGVFGESKFTNREIEYPLLLIRGNVK